MKYAVLAIAVFAAVFAAGSSRGPAAGIIIDYPEDGSVFPPEISPPTFLFRGGGSDVTAWEVDISFGDGSRAIHAAPRIEPMRFGPVDPDCISSTNELPKPSGKQAATRTWKPEDSLWRQIKLHSSAAPALVTITAKNQSGGLRRGSVRIRTSQDPVGAPIFYRDVPLMPTQTEKGVIEPLSLHAVRMVAWRVRNIAEPRSHVVMTNLPMCANCHSFSADGKTMGIDMDGLQNNRGKYALVRVQPEMSIGNDDVLQWRSQAGELRGKIRAGFMSQVSPDGMRVVTTLNPAALSPPNWRPGADAPAPVPSNYYVANFTDYRFLQVFYPTRGVLCWYGRETGELRPLPGADDPNFVQMGAVWTPDGGQLVFARAPARDPNPEGVPLAARANDPNETPVQYDLYRIPFNNGRGGPPVPVAGASQNGMSNSFPKVSPDGRWIVFVQARNGLLMRPDSALYIVPLEGGTARRMRCNTPLMNSWHSFSPNGRWLVFSSKSRSPYTQMYLTHIDADGNDSPAILVENATAANRAVNIPEFVNTSPDGIRSIGGPAIEFFRLFDAAAYLQKRGRYSEAVAAWRKTLEAGPDEELTHRNLAVALMLSGGDREEAERHLQRAAELKARSAVRLDPARAAGWNDLGVLLVRSGGTTEATEAFRRSIELDPSSAPAHGNLGVALANSGADDEAAMELGKAVGLNRTYAPARYHLGKLAMKQGRVDEAIEAWRLALDSTPDYPEATESLATALYSRGSTAEALKVWRKGIELRPEDPRLLCRLALVLATCRDGSYRNGSEAITLARKALRITGGKDAAVLEALAAAYAENGQLADASATARRALDIAIQKKDEILATPIRSALKSYDAQVPLRLDP
jgi:tetratricopeptide (TPR) repeat protein